MDIENKDTNIILFKNKPALKGQGKNQYGLTAKQEHFAQLVAQGSTLTDAYKAAFNVTNSKDSTIWANASAMMRKAHVQARVDMMVEENRVNASHDTARTLQFIRETLQREAMDIKNKASDRLKAIELLGKLSDVGAFKERSETTVVDTRSALELEREIKRKLEKLGLAS